MCLDLAQIFQNHNLKLYSSGRKKDFVEWPDRGQVLCDDRVKSKKKKLVKFKFNHLCN